MQPVKLQSNRLKIEDHAKLCIESVDRRGTELQVRFNTLCAQRLDFGLCTERPLHDTDSSVTAGSRSLMTSSCGSIVARIRDSWLVRDESRLWAARQLSGSCC